MPVEYFIFSVLAAEQEGELHEIVSFSELPDEVKVQTVGIGMPLEDGRFVVVAKQLH